MNAQKKSLLNKQAAEAVAAYEFKTPSKADLAQYIKSATSPAFSLSNSTPGNSMETPNGVYLHSMLPIRSFLNLPFRHIRMRVDYKSRARCSILLLLNLADRPAHRLLLCLFRLDLVGALYPRCLARRRRVKVH